MLLLASGLHSSKSVSNNRVDRGGCPEAIPQPAGTGCDTDASYCSYDSILEAQASRMAVFEARGPCIPTERCLAAYLAAAEPGTYIHCKLRQALPPLCISCRELTGWLRQARTTATTC